MKRAPGIFVMLRFLRFAALILLLPPAAFADSSVCDVGSVYAWVNELRARRQLPQLAADPLLERTASAYASDLSDRGVLSHVDEQGRRALQRYQAQGGTTVLVGEVLGSGAALTTVTAAWEASPGHLDIVLKPLWTHCGAAAARSGSTVVWVLLFTSHRIYPLQGREPVLLSGIEPIDPLDWDPASGEFSYFVSSERGEIYHRLGYSSTDGVLVVTNTFFPEAVTSDREREPR
jgi:hypothetical protein